MDIEALYLAFNVLLSIFQGFISLDKYSSQPEWIKVENPSKTQTEAEKADTQPQPSQAKSTETAEKKLQELQNLYKKGLINQEEYEAKKKQVLDSM
ncbi:SHOCT domain-containing protein [Thermodesulfobacteriota bacterium]